MKHEKKIDNFQKFFLSMPQIYIYVQNSILSPNVVTQQNLDSYPTNKKPTVNGLLMKGP